MEFKNLASFEFVDNVTLPAPVLGKISTGFPGHGPGIGAHCKGRDWLKASSAVLCAFHDVA
jgi:hypothetical protein